MPNTIRRLCLALLLLTQTATGQEAAEAPHDGLAKSNALQLRQVTLYSSGLGALNFEAVVDKAAVFELEVPTAEMSDVLRTLVASDPLLPIDFVRTRMRPDRGRPIDALPDTTSLVDLLMSLRGESVRLELQGGAELSGRLVALENSWEAIADTMAERVRISLLGDQGVESLLLEDVVRVACLDSAAQSRITQALDEIVSQSRASKSVIAIGFSAGERRTVRVGMLRPLPVWKCSYSLRNEQLSLRVVVDNATGEDWQDVSLQIADGQPVAFQVDLDQPMRLERKHLDLPVGLPGIPPMFAEGRAQPNPPPAAMGGRFGGGMGGGMGGMGMGGSFGGGGGYGGGGYGGGGYGGGGYGGGGYGGPGSAPASQVPFGLPGGLALSVQGDLGGDDGIGEKFSMQFEHISLPADTTTVLTSPPIRVSAEALSAYSEAYHPHTPLLAVKLVNQTDMLLPPGPATIYREGQHVGEAMLPRLSPGAPRIVGYALDGAVKVERLPTETSQRVAGVTLDDARRILRVDSITTRVEKFSISNRASSDRKLSIEYPQNDQSWQMEPQAGDELLGETLRLLVPLDAKTETLREIVATQTTQEFLAYQQAPMAQIAQLAQAEQIDPQTRERLGELLRLKREYDVAQQNLTKLETQHRESEREVDRLVKILTTTGLLDEAKQRYLERIEAAEAQRARTTAELTQQQQALQRLRDQLISVEDQPAKARKPQAAADPFGDNPFGGTAPLGNDPFGNP